MKRTTLSALALAIALVLSLGTAFAGDYPDKSVTTIVAFNAGGGTDTAARLIAKFAEKYFPQPLVVVNKPGAGGQIGFEALARAKKDGYTIGGLNTPHVGAHIASNRARYTLEDFLPIANIVTDPGVLAVRADSPFKTLEDVVRLAKEQPGAFTAATTGAGGDDFFALTLFNQAAGIDLREVPTKGSSGEKKELLGGHVDMAFMNVSQVQAEQEAGKIRFLAVMTKKRLADFPEIPTFIEKGFKITSDSSRGFAAPAGISEEAYAMLVQAFQKVVEDPEFLAAAEKSRLRLNFMGPDEYMAYLQDQLAALRTIYEKTPW